MKFSSQIASLLAFAAAAEAAVLATRIATPSENIEAVQLLNNYVDVAVPGELSKRESTVGVYGSGGSRNAKGDGTVSVSVSCGTITVSNIDNFGGLCTAVMAGGFSGCDGCEWNGDFERYSLRVSTKCGNAHIQIGVNTDTGGGDIGENINVHDCNGDAGGLVKSMNICAGDGWSLFRC